MKLKTVSNSPSFGEIVIESDNMSKVQRNTVKRILKNKNLTKKLVKDLENKDTDIYIKPFADGKTVGLTLYTDINYFGIRVIPYEGKYNSSMSTKLNPIKQGEFITNLAIYNFLQRANYVDLNTKKNADLIEKAISDPEKYAIDD